MNFRAKALGLLLACPLLTVAAGFTGIGASAAPLFSVDATTNNLVRIESTTGAVTVVGSLGINAFNMDLTRTADGRLWGLNSNFGTRVDLHEINTTTGAVISTAQVTLGGAGILSGEGLGHTGNQLKIGYSPDGDTFADELANLATTGEISASVVVTIDADGLSTGQGAVPFYAVDRDPSSGVSSTFVYELDPSSLPANLIATFDANDVRSNDILRVGSDLIMVDAFNNELHIFDPTSPTILNSISLGSGDFVGLADAGPVAISLPATVGLFGLGLAGFAVARRRAMEL